jgi:hypothetical protein
MSSTKQEILREIEHQPQLCGKNDLLDSKINMFLDTETEATRFTEVATEQLVFLHLQATLQELHGFLATNSHVACNLLITPDSEGADGVSC